MLRSCLCVVVLGLVAAIASTTAQRVNYTDLSGHYIEFDIITLTTQSEIEAVEPVVKKAGNPDIDSIFAAWVNKFQSAVKTSTMSVQQNVDNRDGFLNSAAVYSSDFATNARTALDQLKVDLFQFHSFMPAATYDVVEYGIVRHKGDYNYTLLDPIKAYMTKNVNSAPIATLQSQLDAYFADSEKQYPGFKKAVLIELAAAYKAVWVNNPTRAPTARPSTNGTSTTNTTAPTATTAKPLNGTNTTAPSTTTPAPVSTTDTPFLGEPLLEEKVSAAPSSSPTPAPTKKSGASVMSATVSAVVLAIASALM